MEGTRNAGSAGPSPVARSLMESLLLAKMERAGFCPPTLVRMDSTDSASSFASSSSMGSEVCRCDDCLLGIADLHISPPGASRKKVPRQEPHRPILPFFRISFNDQHYISWLYVDWLPFSSGCQQCKVLIPEAFSQTLSQSQEVLQAAIQALLHDLVYILNSSSLKTLL
ncbi:hypothetical protein GE061_019946 [Apolygus lucorum]|uniref:Uncharacterized protein n=1 Tax=Apolygus lucorum TaxID=248454 RepID=A0A6A4JZ95_APOLU|nr:hypothetical protein GE061_019946 [Apolygus lucorum]